MKNETNHHVLHLETKLSEGTLSGELYDYYHYFIRCAGCESISYLIKEVPKGESPYAQEAPYTIQYPKYEFRIDDEGFLTDEEQYELPSIIYNLYEEVKAAFNQESQVLAGVGLRVLIEATCLHQNISGGNLKIKIDNLRDQGLISKNEHPIIDKLREIGNASAHQIKSIPLDKLGYALQIVNHMLKSIYVLPKINKKLKI